MNNYEFWEEYLKKVKKEVLELCNKKEKLLVDMHIHSNYSADGKQSIAQILESTKNQGFDIIAITDHDTLEGYKELFEIVKDGSLTNPIVISGIEFTIDNRKYGNQCHLLQLFINPKDNVITKDVETNYNAMFNRSKIQFSRLKANEAIQDILKSHRISISYKEYKNYLILNQLQPEYDTLCLYLIEKFKTNNITTFDVLSKLEQYNEYDCYEDRKNFKTKRYKQLRDKYKINKRNYYNSRFLLSMLAVREVDDDWWGKPNSGSLSVNSFGQLKLEDINEKYKIFFAHPTEESFEVVEEMIKSKKNIVGLELNIRNKYKDITNFYNLLNKYKLYKIIGSDSHDNTLQFYDDMSFFEIDSNDFIKIID